MRTQQEQEVPKRRISTPSMRVGGADNQYLPALSLTTKMQRRLSPSAVLALQQTRGNAAVCRMLAAQRQPMAQRDTADDEADQQVQQPQQQFGPASADQQPASQSDDTPLSDSNSSASASGPNSSSTATPSDSATGMSDTTDTASTNDGGTLIGGPVEGEATPVEVEANAGCADLNLQGLTQASYGGSFTTSAISYTNVGGDVRATGTITCTYTVTTTVTLPTAPSDLSACETGKVNNAIRTILAPHEQRHVAAFRTYAGRTVRRFSFTLAGMSTDDGQAALDAAVQPQLQAMYDSEQATRQSASDAASAALDPFNFTVDCSACS